MANNTGWNSVDVLFQLLRSEWLLGDEKRGAGNDLKIEELLRKYYGLSEWFSALFCPG